VVPILPNFHGNLGGKQRKVKRSLEMNYSPKIKITTVDEG